MTRSKILVTGATGKTGGAVVRRLRAAHAHPFATLALVADIGSMFSCGWARTSPGDVA